STDLPEYLVLDFFFQAEDGIRDGHVTGVQTCALPISVAELNDPGESLSRGFCACAGCSWRGHCSTSGEFPLLRGQPRSRGCRKERNQWPCIARGRKSRPCLHCTHRSHQPQGRRTPLAKMRTRWNLARLRGAFS